MPAFKLFWLVSLMTTWCRLGPRWPSQGCRERPRAKVYSNYCIKTPHFSHHCALLIFTQS